MSVNCRWMNILYIGDQSPCSTSRHRCDALRRIGHYVDAYNPYECMQWNRINTIFHYRTGYVFAVDGVRRHLLNWLGAGRRFYDVVWVDNGHVIGRNTLHALRCHCDYLINYNCDDPTGGRDGARWFSYLRSLDQYDLCAVVRRQSEVEFPQYGAKRVFRVMMSADEVAHAPRSITPAIYEKWKSEVAFVGTWMPERGPFMLKLILAGIPLAIWGNRWSKSPEWSHIRPYWRGSALSGDEYAYAIQCAKINLGLLSKGNRDLHTTRSAEIPSLGGLFCAERTDEHLEIYNEGEEALFWSDVIECEKLVRKMLTDKAGRERIAAAGLRRFGLNKLKNEIAVRDILAAL